jgi:hypothetical protein
MIYIEKRWCDIHVYEHWMEVTRNNKAICRGEEVTPADTEKTYSKHSGHGYKIYKFRKIGLPVAKPVEREIHISQLQVDF